ncbi:phosphodiester glycosidase family protein [Aeribacillus pallidus]|uniref:phosphodiester glycosidase family protein n=1 Tax=Aeribacillus pallidus TaxID=33936 RepID=UPI003D24F852
MKQKVLSVAFIFFFMWFGVNAVSATQLSPGVQLNKEQLTLSGKKQAISVLKINTHSPYTTIKLGISDPIHTLEKTSVLAKKHTYEKHHVIGAINASFFHMQSGYPAYLLSRNDQIINLGAVSSQSNDYMHTPAGFGMKDGKGIVAPIQFTVSIAHHGKNYQLTSFNKARGENESILYTNSYKYDKTRTNPHGLEVVVTGLSKSVDHELFFGETISGVVSSIRPYGQHTSATIPKDGYVISAHGEAVSQIKELQIGDKVNLTIDIHHQWKGADFILASGPLLVQNGQKKLSIDADSPRATERSPRTAVAIDKTGTNVYFVTVDGRQPGYSDGMTLHEFADYLTKLGVYQAINLDGGGSTTMVARLPGNTYPQLVNKPSDGSERKVSAILEAVSLAPYGKPMNIKARQAQEGLIAVGASVGVQIDYILDQYYNVLPINQSEVKLSVEGNIGTITNHQFVAERSGSGHIVVEYGAATTKIPVTVIDDVEKFEVMPQKIYLAPNSTQELTVRAFAKDDKPLIFNKQSVQWEISSDLGKVQNGVFYASSNEGKGILTAKYGTKKVTIPVEISNKPLLLDSFSSITNVSISHVNATSSIDLEKTLQPREGITSLKWDYHFKTSKKGTSVSYIHFKKPVQLVGKPQAIGLWVYGDGQKHWLRGAITDASGKEWIVNFTSYAGLNWYGWKYVKATIPKEVKYPITLSKIYLAEPEENNKTNGTLYLDRLQAEYTLSHKEPYFEPSSDTKTVHPNKVWTITFNKKMRTDRIKDKIYVQDQDGKRYPVIIALEKNNTVVKVHPPQGGYEKEKYYQLVVSKSVLSDQGKMMKRDHLTTFFVE